MPVAPGFMPLKVTKHGVCQKLANLRRGSSKRSIRMRSGSAAWPLVSVVGKSVILSIERGGRCKMTKLSSRPEMYVTVAVITSRETGSIAHLALMMRLPLGDQKMASMGLFRKMSLAAILFGFEVRLHSHSETRLSIVTKASFNA